MGLLAFLYRMMAVAKYRIPDIDEMEVWQCAVALGVDSKMMPMQADGKAGEEVGAKRVTTADMMTPTEVLDIDPSQLMGRMAVATQE